MILKLLSNARIIWVILIKTLKNTTQIKNLKLFVFDDMITNMLSNSKLNPTVTELSIRGRNLNISLAFITQSYFALPKMLD